MNISEKIKKLRNDNNLTQDELSKKCGISKNALWNYENNKREIPLSVLKKIAISLDVNITDLMEVTENHSSDLEIKTTTVYCFFKELNIKKENFKELNLNDKLSLDVLKIICKRYKLDEYCESFLYSQFIFIVEDIYKPVEFYNYLYKQHGYDLFDPTLNYIETGEIINETFNTKFDLSYHNDFVNRKKVGLAISNNTTYIKLLKGIATTTNTIESDSIDKASPTQIYKIILKIKDELETNLIFIDGATNGN